MRPQLFVLAGLLGAVTLAQPARAAAQSTPPPVIHRVALQPDSGIITITGTGLGGDLQVTVDGQPLPQLPGATDTQLEVLAPVTVVTMPGTYRLTVVDPMRRVGDGFVVTGPSGSVIATGGASPAGVRPAPPAAAEDAAASASSGGARNAAAGGAAAPSPPTVIENSGSPYRTAIGYQALLANTTGDGNTASGYQALRSTNTGAGNTASGFHALFSNTTGSLSTASGFGALQSSTTASYNTAVGADALYSTTTGERNVAAGYQALQRNTIGSANPASGVEALFGNTSGSFNVATFTYALHANTTGVENVASGYAALFNNTVGFNNTATGTGAMYANTTGLYNTATGREALRNTTNGSFNVATGATALHANVSGSDNTATGVSALEASTASFNTAHGTNALLNTTTGGSNVGVGSKAGASATTGSYNIYLGADVLGTASDANTIRIGLPYDSGTGAGQTQTFVAGIHGTQVTGSYLPVVVNASGQLGTLIPAVVTGGPAALVTPAALAQQVHELPAIVADLRARLARSVVDPARQVGDAFVVATHAAAIPVGGAARTRSTSGPIDPEFAARDPVERAFRSTCAGGPAAWVRGGH